MGRRAWAVRRVGLGLLLGLGAQAAAAGEIYRWVDAHGQVHFSDRAQAGAVRRSARGKSAPPNTGKAPADEAACEAAQARLLEIRNAGSIVEEDALGQRRTLDEAQRLQLIERRARQRDDACAAAE